MSLASGPGIAGSNTSDLPDELQLAVSAHVSYIQSLDTVRFPFPENPNPPLTQPQRKDELENWLTEHLRMNGLYWGLTALHLLRHPSALSRKETIDFVLSCQHANGGFGAAPGHDAHLLSTVSAVQILATVDAVEELEARGKGGKEGVAKCASFPYFTCLLWRGAD
jgi:geranylgeranyl transferase type-2 subunit beta